MSVHSTVVANRLIDLARDRGGLTQMQIQKLTYIAHGFHLAIFDGESLTSDAVKAYEYGPVYPELGMELRVHGSEPVFERVECKPEILLDDEKEVVDEVYKSYGKFDAWKLSALTHKEGTPWDSIYANGRGKFEKIPNEQIREHFLGIINK